MPVERRSVTNDIVNISIGDNLATIGGGAIQRIGELVDITVDDRGVDTNIIEDIVNAVDDSLTIDDEGIVRSSAWRKSYQQEQVIDIIKESGFLRPIQGSFHGGSTVDRNAVCVIGADAGSSMERSIVMRKKQSLGAELIVLVGSRLMDSVVDLANPGIRAMRRTSGENQRPITEALYAGTRVMPQLEQSMSKKLIDYISSGSSDGLGIAQALFLDRDDTEGELMAQEIVCTMAGGLSMQLACKLRIAGQSIYGDIYDSDPSMPNILMSAPGSRLAVNQDQLRNPENFENPSTVIRSIATTLYWVSQAGIQPKPFSRSY
jgi:hypothetical protein